MASSEYQRINRLKKRITNMLKNNNNCYFLTFTFRNHVIESKNQLKRLRYVKQYLSDFANEYILNIDYGKITKREHYHAIATPKYKIFLCDAYKLGNLEYKKIHENGYYKAINKNNDAIAKRFLNHATKETTKQSKIIFARRNHQSEIKYNLKLKIDAFLNGKKADFDINAFLDEELQEMEKYREEHGEPPTDMQAIYDYLHRKSIDNAAEVKTLQGMFR